MKYWRVTHDDGSVVDIPDPDVLNPVDAARGRDGYGVYEAVDVAGDILYTGRTRDLASRLSQHQREAAWWPLVAAVRWIGCSNYAEAVALERAGISQDRGHWNESSVNDLPASGTMRLPDATARRLVALYAAADQADGSRDFDNFVRSLRWSGWTFQAIATPLNITRERVRQRCSTGAVDHDLLLPSPPVKIKRERRRKARPHLSAEERDRMAELQRSAVLARGRHPHEHPHKQASRELTDMLVMARLRGVRFRELAEALGVSSNAVRFRLSRYGYLSHPPSQGRPTGQPPARVTHCKAGHSLEGENARFINGDPNRRQCRACEKRRAAEYKERKRAVKEASA